MILVTGHRGHIGRVVCNWLDRNNRAWRGYDLIEGDDIADYDKLRRVITEYDIRDVIHLAALKDPAGSFDQADAYRKTNYTDTIALIDLCIELGVPKFQFASTNSIAYNNRSPYTQYKKLVEDYLYENRLYCQITPTIYRFESFLDVTPCVAYRPNTHSLLDNLYNTYMGKQGEFILYGNSIRQFMTAEDIELLLEREYSTDSVVESRVIGPIVINTAEFVDLFEGAVGEIPITQAAPRDWENTGGSVTHVESILRLSDILLTMKENIDAGIV